MSARLYFDGDRALVPLANARGVAVIDTDDAHLVSSRLWRLHTGGYAQCGNRLNHSLMHRIILPGCARVDHINGDRLDNRRRNLRAATHTENLRNSRKNSRGSSRFKGVSRCKSSGKWRAYIRSGTQVHLGHFATEEAAARAYDRAALERFGAFAKLNFPDGA